MHVRDAVETDAEALADIADAPVDVMRNLVHDRTVRVAEDETDGGRETGEGGEADTADERETDAAGEEAPVCGFVSFDARDRTVHVTQIGGTADACDRLLEEPIRFASSEDMAVEMLVEQGDEKIRSAVERAGFTERGSGPAFEGAATTRYRLDGD